MKIIQDLSRKAKGDVERRYIAFGSDTIWQKRKLTRNTWADVFGIVDRKPVLPINEFDDARETNYRPKYWLRRNDCRVLRKVFQTEKLLRTRIINCHHSNETPSSSVLVRCVLTPLALLNPLRSLTSPNFVTNTRHFLLLLSGAHHETYYGHEPRGNPTFSSSISLCTRTLVNTYPLSLPSSSNVHHILEIVARRRCT